jgi:ParB family chromosome partitioning protein
MRAQRLSRAESDQRPKRAAQPHAPSRSGAVSAEDQDLIRNMEQILGTPVSIARTDRDLRVTIVFHTDEKLQEFFDLLNSTQSD